jgi:YesN/AraC family two-component response regulator
MMRSISRERLHKKPYVVLYAEDAKDIRERTASSLRLLFEKVYTAEDGVQAMEEMRKHQIDIVISDINMPNMSGIDLVKEIRAMSKTLPIIITTGHAEFVGVYENVYNIETLTKPYSIFDIIKVVNEMQNKNKIVEDSEAAYNRLEEGYEEAKKLLQLLDIK